jgi:hypothetical protein
MTAVERSPCPEVSELGRFMRGGLSRPENLLVVRHLLTGCPRCVAVTRWWWNLGILPLLDPMEKLEVRTGRLTVPQGELGLRKGQKP